MSDLVLEKLVKDLTELRGRVASLEALESGGIWLAYTPTWTSASDPQPVLNNGTLTGRYCQIGKKVILIINFVAGNTTTFGTSYWNFSLPVTAAGTVLETGSWVANHSGTYYTGTVLRTTTALLRCPTNAASFIAPATPFAWASTDTLRLSLTYEGA